MKTKQIIIFFLASLIMSACGDDEPVYIHDNSKRSSIGDDKSANDNKNTSGPKEAQTRYEFPRLKGGSDNVVIVHRAMLNQKIGEEGINYCVEWDTGKHAQRWSCYQLYSSVNYKSGDNVTRYKADNDGTLSSYCQYPNDPDLKAEHHFTTDPYKGSGFDHGHICPSADRLRATEANYQTFYMTNMQPQRNAFNAGLWEKMEERVRYWADQNDTLYVCKGGTIDSERNIRSYLGSGINKIPVPRYFFMALFGKKGTAVRALGLWVEHLDDDHSNDNIRNYAVSIKRLEELTGIDFFCNLPDDTEKKAEADLNLSDWNLQ